MEIICEFKDESLIKKHDYSIEDFKNIFLNDVNIYSLNKENFKKNFFRYLYELVGKKEKLNKIIYINTETNKELICGEQQNGLKEKILKNVVNILKENNYGT